MKAIDKTPRIEKFKFTSLYQTKNYKSSRDNLIFSLDGKLMRRIIVHSNSL
jgi:hypothetical protein